MSAFTDFFDYPPQAIIKEPYEKGLKEGIEIGKREGIEIGKREGIEIGKREGMREGIEIGKREGMAIMVKQLVDKFGIDKTAQLLGMSEQEILKLIKSLETK